MLTRLQLLWLARRLARARRARHEAALAAAETLSAYDAHIYALGRCQDRLLAQDGDRLTSEQVVKRVERRARRMA